MPEISSPGRVGKMLMSLATAIYGFVPPIADFNATHAGNPLWPGHARFHVVWQVIITFGLALLGLYLLWAKIAEKEMAIRISFLLGVIVLAGFLSNSLVMHFYGGSLIDPNGYPPLVLGIDGNLILFSLGFALLLAGYWMTQLKAK